MTLLEQNKKYINGIFKSNLKYALKISKLISIIIIILILAIGPIIKFIYFPEIIHFTNDEINKYEQVAMSVWNDGAYLNEYKIKNFEIYSNDVTQADLCNSGFKYLDFEKINSNLYYDNKSEKTIFIAFYDNLIISLSMKKDSNTPILYIHVPTNSITYHSLKCRFNSNEINSIDDYEMNRASEISHYYMISIFLAIVLLILNAVIISIRMR